jgi:hypothetical protein
MTTDFTTPAPRASYGCGRFGHGPSGNVEGAMRAEYVVPGSSPEVPSMPDFPPDTPEIPADPTSPDGDPEPMDARAHEHKEHRV